MLKEPFKDLKLSRYASQILQQYRNYVFCTYKFRTQVGGTKELTISDDYKSIRIIGKTWDSVAFELNKQMADAARTFRLRQTRRWLDDGILQRANNN